MAASLAISLFLVLLGLTAFFNLAEMGRGDRCGNDSGTNRHTLWDWPFWLLQ